MGCILKGGGGLYSRLVVGAVVLASSPGERVGRRPTCLLELGGVPLIRRLLIALSGAGVDEVVVVLGQHAELIEPALQDFPITVVRDNDRDSRRASSLRIGLAALAGKIDAVLVARADQPMINAQDLTQLIGAYKKRPEGKAMVMPQVDGVAGKPVILSADLREQMLASTAQVDVDGWRTVHSDLVSDFVSPNKRYRIDIGSPDEIARFEASTGHRLSWPASLMQTADAG